MKQTIIKTVIIAGVLTSLAACTAMTDVTSSTSSTTDAVTPDVTLNNFIDKRYHAIRNDAARGQGENIEALSRLMGETDPNRLAGWMQHNYEQLFGHNARPSDLVTGLEQYNARVRS